MPFTSNTGWDTVHNREFLSDVVNEFQAIGIRTSIFVNADLEMIQGASAIGTDRIELYTGPYAEMFPRDRETAVAPFVEAATLAKKLGLGVNAGHDLNLQNLNYLYVNIPWLKEVSIGHALICDALYLGLEKTIKAYKNCLKLPKIRHNHYKLLSLHILFCGTWIKKTNINSDEIATNNTCGFGLAATTAQQVVTDADIPQPL
jgi:pyridoxine 5'-phosphate synthase PdxJ